MKELPQLHELSGTARIFLVAFLFALTFGYATGFLFVERTTGFNAEGIERNVNGNEQEEDADVFRFKKPEAEILTIVHTHALSMSMIFLALGALVLMTPVPTVWKKILVIEPFVSIILTFGGIWLVWSGVTWFRYVIMVSGTALNLSYALSVAVTLRYLFK